MATSHDHDSAQPPIRCVTIDVEEYFQIEAAHGRIERAAWSDWPSRVEPVMDELLAMLAEHRCRATLFILGYIAQTHPQLVKRCAQAGHEIASHGFMHDRLHRLTPDTFREDVVASKRTLEDLTGQPVCGYRAPTWSVTRSTHWAIDVLAESGFTYDASIFPVRHHWYGVPDAPAEPFYVQGSAEGRPLLEVPPLVWQVGSKNVPVAGGGYFRLLPLALMKQGLAQAARQRRQAVLYFHPWEFDPGIPKMPLSATGRLRTYTGLGRSKERLAKILRRSHDWRPIADHLPGLERIARSRRPVVLRPADGNDR